MTFEQYLDSLNLSADERAAMNTPANKRFYDATNSQLATVAAERDAAINKRKEYEGQVQTWYEKEVANRAAKDREVVTARAEAARLAAAWKAAETAGIDGLSEITKSLGLNEPPPDPNAGKTPTQQVALGENYYTKDQINGVAKEARTYNETLLDITNEHRRLFNETPSFRELRAEADAAGMGLEAFWNKKFNIAAKRQEVANQAVKDRDEAIRKEERERIHSEMLARGVNPDLAGPSSSVNPLRPVKRDGVRDGSKQPWEYGDQSGARVQQALDAWQKSPLNPTRPH